MVQRAQLGEDLRAEHLTGDLTSARAPHAVVDGRHRRVDGLGGHGQVLHGLEDAGADLLAVIRLGDAAALADEDPGLLRALVGREAPPAAVALPAPADGRALLGSAR